MLKTPTMDKLQDLKLNGMLKGLEEQHASSEYETLSFDERFGLLVDRESIERENRRLKTRLKQAKLRQIACFEDIDFRHPRGLDKSVILPLGGCRWIKEHQNILITGATGVGKSFLACIVTSQLPVEHWHEVIGNPTIADAILDRLVHNAHKINLSGDSMRKKKVL